MYSLNNDKINIFSDKPKVKEYTINMYSVKAYLYNNHNKNGGQDLKTMT